MRPDLDSREWDVPLSRRVGVTTASGRKLRAVARDGFVQEGYVTAKRLGLSGSSRTIPAGECAVTSLAVNGPFVLGATSGRRAHLFSYDSRPANESVMHLRELRGHTHVERALAMVADHGLFVGTRAPGASGYDGGEVFRVDLSYPGWGDVIQEWGRPIASLGSLGIPVPGEGVACLIGDESRLRLYGLSDATGTLFSVDVTSGEFALHGQIDDSGIFSARLILGPDGRVYACGAAGMLVVFDPDAGRLEATDLHLPAMMGRQHYSRLGDWVVEANSGLIYAGDVADGVLSTLDVRTMELRMLGKPTAQPHVRCLASAPDGRIFGVTGVRDGVGRLFFHSPASGEMRDLGVMTAATDRRWYGYEFDCAAAGPDGRIYFGETDRISHLFVYFPALATVSTTDRFRYRAPTAVVKTGSQL